MAVILKTLEEIERLALSSVDIDNNALNFATDALLLLGDVIASVIQELSDGNVDVEPENGICGTPGAVADLDRCIESALAEHLVPELEVHLDTLLTESIASSLPGAQTLTRGAFSVTEAPSLSRAMVWPCSCTACQSYRVRPSSSASIPRSPSNGGGRRSSRRKPNFSCSVPMRQSPSGFSPDASTATSWSRWVIGVSPAWLGLDMGRSGGRRRPARTAGVREAAL